MLRFIALACIRGYQKHLSPRKGFSCAYRVYKGGASCSAHGYRAISRHGVFLGLQLISRRLDRCALAHADHKPSAVPSRVHGMARAQAGFIDSCDADLGACEMHECAGGCDVSPGDIGSGCLDGSGSCALDALQDYFWWSACSPEPEPCGGRGTERERNRQASRDSRRRAAGKANVAGEAGTVLSQQANSKQQPLQINKSEEDAQ